MTLRSESARAEILALHSEISASALDMTHDEGEANKLANLTLERALATPLRAGQEEALDTRLWLFSVLRSEFHSVERQRQARRERGFTVANRQTAIGEKNP